MLQFTDLCRTFTMLLVFRVATLCLLVSVCQSYSLYQEQIPNGNKVPHPCKKNYRWPGVGHNNPLGGGARNKFGVDFQATGSKWTQALCQMDSDGDGRTNGQELGDPNCVWSQGQTPERNHGITNPGVCDPHDSPSCKPKNSFLSCALDQFQGCDAVTKPNVTTLDLKFNETEIPAETTTYMCQGFKLEQESDHHIIASEPLIDNKNVLHHMIVFACDDGISDHDVDTTPHHCGMVREGCMKMISAWTVGLSGQCFGPTAGFRIGPTSHKTLMLQMHYYNPLRSDNYTDASGIRLYVQPALPEVQNMVTFYVGQTQLMLRPGQNQIKQYANCPGSCSSQLLAQPIYVLAAANHMHYLGQSMQVELFRNGTKIANIARDDGYNYDSPVIHNHIPPLEIRPGDDIKTTCIFNTVRNNHYVKFGQSTEDEMCFGFMYVYPQEAFRSTSLLSCESLGPADACTLKNRQPIAGCDWRRFPFILYEVLHGKCPLSETCTPECRESLMLLRDNPCLKGEASTFFRRFLLLHPQWETILGWLHSCNIDKHNYSKPDAVTNGQGSLTDASNKISTICSVLIISMAVVSIFL